MTEMVFQEQEQKQQDFQEWRLLHWQLAVLSSHQQLHM